MYKEGFGLGQVLGGGWWELRTFSSNSLSFLLKIESKVGCQLRMTVGRCWRPGERRHVSGRGGSGGVRGRGWGMGVTS